MTKAMGVGIALAAVLHAASAAAQVKTITGETQNVTATVEAVQQSSRLVTLKDKEGNHHVLYVPTDVKRFDTVKVGDTLNLKYHENVTLRPHEPGAKVLDETTGARTPSAGDKAGGTAAVQRTITAKITAIDMAAPSVTFTGPNGWNYSSRVEDKAALSKVKVGDQFDITWTMAIVAGMTDGTK